MTFQPEVTSQAPQKPAQDEQTTLAVAAADLVTAYGECHAAVRALRRRAPRHRDLLGFEHFVKPAPTAARPP